MRAASGLAEAMEMLQATSRTFAIPILTLPPGLQEACVSGYLVHRAVDEIEDHPELPVPTKIELLGAVSAAIRSGPSQRPLAGLFRDFPDLPPVTTGIDDWLHLAPRSIAPRIWEAAAAVADRMAYWCARGWRVDDEADLDRYTYDVAGSVGLLQSDLFAWFDGTAVDRVAALGLGRGLQAVNILLDLEDDRAAGRDLCPQGWGPEDLAAYAKRNLALVRDDSCTPGPARLACDIPRALAWASLAAFEAGRGRLTRPEVLDIVRHALGGTTTAPPPPSPPQG